MTRQTATQTQQQTTTTSLLSRGGILQRQCESCRQHTIAGGECVECGKQKSGLQRKLTIGASNDPLEREADRVADQVIAASAHPAVSDAPPRIQRFTGQTGQADMAAPASVDRVLSSPGRPLDPVLQQDMGQRFGHDFSRVRVHTGSAAEQSAQDVYANAYTVGHNIVFGARQFAPGTHKGRRLIAHELTHVVQQRQAGAGNQQKVNPPGDLFEQAAAQTAAQVIDGHPATVNGAVSVGVQCEELSEEEKRKAMQAKTQCESNQCHPDRRADQFKDLSLFTEPPNRAALRQQFALTNQKSSEASSSVEKKQEKGAHSPPPVGLRPKPVKDKDSLTQTLQDLENAQRNLGKPKDDYLSARYPSSMMSPEEMAPLIREIQGGDQQAKGAHSPPPAGLRPKPVKDKDSLTQTLEDLENPQRNLGKLKDDYLSARYPSSTMISPEERTQLIRAIEETKQQEEEAKQKLKLADGTVISLNSPPPEKKLPIPPPQPGELTRDITFEGSVLAKANVEGERLHIIHNLDVELKRIEDITEISRGSAQQFLEKWPIMHRLADLTAGANPPSMSIWLDVDVLIKQSREAIRQSDLEKAIQLQEQANKALRNAQATWYRYKEKNIGGAESIKTGGEYTRDGAKYTLMALATVASGGTALAVTISGNVAIDVTEAATKAALGEKVDWGQVAVDVAIQIVLAKFGGKLSSGLMGALQKNPATQKVEAQFLQGIVHSLINGVESRAISTYIRALYQTASTQNKPITWSEFIDQLVAQITDPKSIVIDIILGGVAAKARARASGDKQKLGADISSPKQSEAINPSKPPAQQRTPVPTRAKPPQEPAEVPTTSTPTQLEPTIEQLSHKSPTIDAAEGSETGLPESLRLIINARKRQAMRNYEALKPVEILDRNFETTLLNEPEAIWKQIKATKADITSNVDKVAQLRQRRDVLVEAKQKRKLNDSEADNLDKLNQRVTEFESQQKHLDTLEKIPLHDKRTIEGFSSATKIANQAVRTPRKIAQLLAEVEWEALKLQQQSPNPQERELATKGKPSSVYLEQASKKIAIESGLPEPFDLTAEHGKFDDNHTFVQGVVKQGKPFVDKQFNPGEDHGQNVHLLQLILVQRAFKKSGLSMTVPEFMEHMSSTPKSEEVWESVFDPKKEGAINKPEQFTDVYRKAFGRSRE